MKRVLITIVALALSGCMSAGTPAINSAPYVGPVVSVDSTGAQHRIILAAPSSGWSLTFDRSQKLFDRTEAFVTINRPNPAYPTTPAMIALHLDSAIQTRDDLIVFVRVLDHGQSQGPYQRAAASTPKK